MRKVRKAMIPHTKPPQKMKPGASPPFRVHHKGVDGDKSAIHDAGVDTMVPLKKVRSASAGGGMPPKPKAAGGRARKPSTSKMSDKALLKSMPFNG